jgi:hypothetical protein
MQPACFPVPTEIDRFAKNGFPRTSIPLALGDGALAETVNHGDDKNPDKERDQRMSMMWLLR